MKKIFTKSLFALVLGVGVTSLSTSAFAAACPFQDNAGATTTWTPYAATNNQVQQPKYAFAGMYYFVPVQYAQTNAPFFGQVPGQNQVKIPTQYKIKYPGQYQVEVPSQKQGKAPTQNQVTAPSQSKKQVKQDQSSSSYANEILSLVNQERAKAGLQPLTLDSKLSTVATDKAKDMANNHYFDHTSPTYGSPFDMMKQYGIQFMAAGENIAMGQQSPQEVMTQWMNSQGHRENILNTNFTKIGIGFYNGYWVQEFIG